MTRLSEGHVHPIFGALRSTTVPAHALGHGPAFPFITISRQAGAGGHTLSHALVNRLNAPDSPAPGDTPWQEFDRALVEKVAADLQVSTKLIESLEESSASWLEQFFSGLSLRDEAMTEERVLHRVAATVRALAQTGRVILVGCGACFITQGMPNGIHVRLVAKFNHRITAMARQLNLNLDAAAAEVRRIDRARETFLHRYWPNRPVTPEEFTLTLNSSALSESEMVDLLLPLIHARIPAQQSP